MLVLSRKENERIVCGEGENQIIITLVRSSPHVCRIGVEAARNIPVHRGEVYDVIQERREAEIRNAASTEERKHEV